MTQIRNPEWANVLETVVNCEINHPEYGWIPFSACEHDPEEHGRMIFEKCIAGEYGPIAEYVTPPVSAPKEITMRQCRLQLLSDGLLDAVGTAINALPSPQKEAAQIEWEYSAKVSRDSALIASLAPALGLTDADIETLFIEASQL